MVKKMLDIVHDDLQFVDKTFFEPAAGTGNFLVAILDRKLKTVRRLYQPEYWPQESLFALASIYGVELLVDNHAEAQEAMLEEFVEFHAANGNPCSDRTNLYRAAEYLIFANIAQGNTLTGRNDFGDLIEFSWWNRVRIIPGHVLREPFTLASLREKRKDMLFDLFETEPACTFQPVRIDLIHKEAPKP